jgi:hypothetical protein
MGIRLKSIAIICSATAVIFADGPSVTFTGYLDADAVADFKGKYYANTELDLGMTASFSDNVSAHVYTTVNNVYSPSGLGNVPAGVGEPDERWLDVKFDGFDITYASKLGTFTVGDIVYQYGKFNYYVYKRFSMITNENFSRGVKYGIGNELVSTELQVGITDLDNSSGDIQGTTKFCLGKNHSLAAYYGVRGSSLSSFETGSDFFAGAEYLGTFGDAFKLKFDFGLQNVRAASKSEDRPTVMSLLLEPSFAFDKFSVAATGFLMIDPDTINSLAAPLYSKVLDEGFLYIEPGYAFNDYISVGLPIEVHAREIDVKNDDEFWLVPTLYVYPAKNVQWWIWGQMVNYFRNSHLDPAFYAGSEIIVTF